MKMIPLVATSEKVDIKKNNITYETDVEAPAGVIVLTDSSGERGMLPVNQIHSGGRVQIVMRPFIVPCKKYNVGETIATLIVL